MILVSISYAFICWRSHRVPNGPFTLADSALPNQMPPNSQRVIVLGDSLTHGTMSHNWLEDLQAEFEGEYAFVNAGTNGDLAWNALQKIDQVSACKPDIIAIFIGGNDALASLSPIWADNFITRKGLPQSPTAGWYRQNLEAIICNLQTKTDAELAICTLTLFGEDLRSSENEQMRTYSQIAVEVAKKYQIQLLPIHQNLCRFLTTRQIETGQKPTPATSYAIYRKLMRQSIIRYHFLFQSWDKISSAHQYVAQTDGVHLNSQAAGVITDTFRQWLKTAK
ncbi:MAG: SGNH/GDSL hydrolase family protein [Anaerolineae bacterium]